MAQATQQRPLIVVASSNLSHPFAQIFRHKLNTGGEFAAVSAQKAIGALSREDFFSREPCEIRKILSYMDSRTEISFIIDMDVYDPHYAKKLTESNITEVCSLPRIFHNRIWPEAGMLAKSLMNVFATFGTRPSDVERMFVVKNTTWVVELMDDVGLAIRGCGISDTEFIMDTIAALKQNVEEFKKSSLACLRSRAVKTLRRCLGNMHPGQADEIIRETAPLFSRAENVTLLFVEKKNGASNDCVPAIRIELPDLPVVRENADAVADALVSGIQSIFSPNHSKE